MTEKQKNFCHKVIEDATIEGLVNASITFEEDFKKSSFELVNRGYEAIVAYINRIPQLRNAPRLRMQLADKAMERTLFIRSQNQ